MKITVQKITGKDLLDLACSYTVGKPVNVQNLKRMYQSEHSPIRTQIFIVEMRDIPTFVSVHYVRHTVGVQHYVKSNRIDRDGDPEANRNTPVNHMMLANAQALINIARKRLCSKSSDETRQVMREIVWAIRDIDPQLAECLQPECQYRGGCYEFSGCGLMPRRG